MSARFVLAKYAPNVHRMEPRNIGVFVWHKGRTAYRMLPAEAADFVNDKSTYLRWCDFWADMIGRDEIRPERGTPVPRADDRFLDAFCATEDGNYLLEDAGFVTQKITVRELDRVAAFLFDDLVAPPKADRAAEKQRFAAACKEAISQSGLSEVLRKRFPVQLGIYGVKRKVRFSYGVGDAEPDSLLQKASLEIDASVHDAALKLYTAYSEAVVRRERCAVLVDASGSAEMTDRARDNFDFLKAVCTVIDVSKPDQAADLIRQTAA